MLRARTLLLCSLLGLLLLPVCLHAQNAATSAEGTGLPVDQGQTADFDLNAAVTRGLRFNPDLAAAKAQVLGSEYGRKSALGAFGPSAQVGYGFTHLGEPAAVPSNAARGGTKEDEIYRLTFTVTQPVFTGFALLSRYQRAALAEDLAQAQFSSAELRLVQAVQESFLTLLKGRMDVKNGEDAVARLESQLKVTKAFFGVGLKPKLDVLQAEVDLASSRQELLLAQNSVATQTARLNSLLAIPLSNPTTYVGELAWSPFETSLEECLNRAYRHRPDLDIGRKAVEIADKDVKIVASDLYPKVSANYQYSQAGDTPAADGFHKGDTGYTSWQVGARMDWTVFEWGKTYNAVRQSKENVAKVAADLERARLDAGFEVKRNHLALREAEERIGVARKALEAAREGYRMAEARYQAQVGTITDVLDAQSRVSRAEAQQALALADYNISLARLYVSMGEKNTALLSR